MPSLAAMRACSPPRLLFWVDPLACCVVLGRSDVSVLRAGLLSIYSHPRHANKMAPEPCILYSTKPHVLSAGFPLVRAAEWFFLCAHHLILSKGAGWQQNLNRIKLSQATHFLTLNPSKFLFCTSFTKLLCLHILVRISTPALQASGEV